MTTNIPLPPGAVDVTPWDVNRDETVTRGFIGTKRGTSVQVGIYGDQDYSGRVLRRFPFVETARSSGVELDEAGLREAAADFLAAADELHALNTH